MKTATKLGIALMIFAAGYLLWYFRTTPPAPVGVHVPAKVAPQVATLPKVSTPAPKGIKTYPQIAKKTLKLDPAIIADDSIHVIESTRVSADDHAHTVTVLVNTKTGETTTLDRREPLPWLAFKKTGEAKIDYGIRHGVDRVVRLSIRQDLLQVKALYAGVSVSLDSDGQYFAGAGVGYRW